MINNAELNAWLMLANSTDSFKRLICIDEIPDLPNEEIIPVLLKLLNDEHALVRTCAAEIVVEYAEGHESIVHASLKAMLEREEDMLASAYAIISFCEMAKLDDLNFIVQYLESTSEKYLRFHVIVGLFLAAQKILVEHFKEAISDSDTPHMQRSSVNLMKYLYESVDLNRTHVTDILRKAIHSEQHARMKETMSAVLEEIEKPNAD